ncbi:MAG: LAGLIDADG family homing endonuclease [Patescibacteria group bacterium]
MGKRGPKPRGKVKIKWSANFAYAIGLIATDGNLSPDNRHISFTSIDKEMVDNFQKALSISYDYCMKGSGSGSEKKYYVIQIGDVLFYKFLQSIGLTSNKSKTIGKIDVPQKYMRDFIRGSFDGDGCSYSYWDKRWKSSFMLYLEFISASKKHITWLQDTLRKEIEIKGHITKSKNQSCFQLKYAKNESVILFKYMYKNKESLFLTRKYLKIKKSLGIVKKQESINAQVL